MTREWDEIKYEVAVANRVLAEVGLATGIQGVAGTRQPATAERP